MLVCFDYHCPTCSTTQERLEDRPAPSHVPCACGGLMQRQIGAPHIGDSPPTATRGKSDPVPPGSFSTRALAEGMPRREWDKKRSEHIRRTRYEQIKANT
jgi:hypothetical protein